MGFETKSEAQRFLEALHERMAKFGLSLNEEKTRIWNLDGMRPNAAHAGGNAARKRSTSSGSRTCAVTERTRLLRLIRKWLTAGVVDKGSTFVLRVGTPQGAVISP